MNQHLEAIARQLQAAQLEAGTGSGAYVEFLDRVMQEVRNARSAARLELFGKQFAPSGATELEAVTGQRKYQPADQVRTPEGYLAYVVGYDARKPGTVVVNVVCQATDYKESQLTEAQ